jgi:Photoprotection regulator fluorescence recovery protein
MTPATEVGDHMRDLKWAPAEKAVARKAFRRALQRELAAVVRKTKDRVAKIDGPSELWDLESYLTNRRKDIDRRYDFRYSVLPLVFGNLIREGRLAESDLHGLGDDKLDWIRRHAKP